MLRNAMLTWSEPKNFGTRAVKDFFVVVLSAMRKLMRASVEGGRRGKAINSNFQYRLDMLIH